MKASVQISGIGAAKNLVSGFSARRVSAAVATALNRTAVKVRDAERQAMATRLDRPTRYTLNALWIETATANAADAGVRAIPQAGDPYNSKLTRSRHLQATVGIKDESAGNGTPATKYLMPQVAGGARHVKRFERALQAAGAMPTGWQAVPAAGARLDAYGNISRGQIGQILSQVGVKLTAGYERNMSADARKRINAQRRAGGRFFAVLPGQSRLTPGVYQREFVGRNITPVLIYVKASAYRVRLPFDAIGQQVAKRELRGEISRAIAEHVAKLRGMKVGGVA